LRDALLSSFASVQILLVDFLIWCALLGEAAYEPRSINSTSMLLDAIRPCVAFLCRLSRAVVQGLEGFGHVEHGHLAVELGRG
jgi:hypothetical protein